MSAEPRLRRGAECTGVSMPVSIRMGNPGTDLRKEAGQTSAGVCHAHDLHLTYRCLDKNFLSRTLWRTDSLAPATFFCLDAPRSSASAAVPRWDHGGGFADDGKGKGEREAEREGEGRNFFFGFEFALAREQSRVAAQHRGSSRGTYYYY